MSTKMFVSVEAFCAANSIPLLARILLKTSGLANANNCGASLKLIRDAFPLLISGNARKMIREILIMHFSVPYRPSAVQIQWNAQRCRSITNLTQFTSRKKKVELHACFSTCKKCLDVLLTRSFFAVSVCSYSFIMYICPR